jgi:hypothetical protein
MGKPTKKNSQLKTGSLVYAWLLFGCVLFISAVVSLLPRVLSDDPCFDDWDIACTTAPKFLRVIDTFGLIILAAAYYIVLPIFIALTLIIGSRWIHEKMKRRTRHSK